MVYTTLAGLARYRDRAAGTSAAIATAKPSIGGIELKGQRNDLSINNAYEAYLVDWEQDMKHGATVLILYPSVRYARQDCQLLRSRCTEALKPQVMTS